MKKFLLIGFILFGSLQLFAQQDDHQKQIQALKTAYITEGLNLNSQEAEKFWPIYNAYIVKRRDLYRRQHADVEHLECLCEAEAKDKLKEYVEIERQDYVLRKTFYGDLMNFFTAKRLIQLHNVENNFNKKMIREYRERHNK